MGAFRVGNNSDGVVLFEFPNQLGESRDAWIWPLSISAQLALLLPTGGNSPNLS